MVLAVLVSVNTCSPPNVTILRAVDVPHNGIANDRLLYPKAVLSYSLAPWLGIAMVGASGLAYREWCWHSFCSRHLLHILLWNVVRVEEAYRS